MVLLSVLWMEYLLFSLNKYTIGLPSSAGEKMAAMRRAIPSTLQTVHKRAKKSALVFFSLLFRFIEIIIGTYNSRTLQLCPLSKYSSLNSKVSSAFLIGGKTTLNSLVRRNFCETGCDEFLETIRYIQ